MNLRHFTLNSLIALSLTAGATAPALADDGLALRVATSMGQLIAEQGNRAFVQIREDLKDDLAERFEQWLAAPDAGSQPQGSTQSADVQ